MKNDAGNDTRQRDADLEMEHCNSRHAPHLSAYCLWVGDACSSFPVAKKGTLGQQRFTVIVF